jgi:hypothetical protein
LVEHGANQTPFLAVKSATEGDETMTKRTTTKSTPVAKASAERVADLHKMVFSGDDFATEEAVRSYLDTNAYKNAKIVAEGTTYVVKGLDADKFEGEIKTIQARKGLVMHAGTLKADAAPAAEAVDKNAAPAVLTLKTALAATAPELTQKWCSWLAEYSDAKTLSDAIEAGKDGLPPGIWEINYAFYAALKNVLGDDDVTDKPTKVQALCAEYADYINALQAILENTDMTTKVSKAALLTAFKREPVAKAENVNIRVTFNDSSTQDNDERASAPTTAAILPAATGTVDGPGEINNTGTNTATVAAGIPVTGSAPEGPSELAAKGTETTAETVQPVATAEAAPVAAPAATDANDLASVLKAIMGPVTAAITTLTEAVAKTASDQTAALAKVEETVTKTVERVDAVEHRSTSRKGADEAGTPSSTVTETTKSAPDRHTRVLRGNLIGSTRRRS